MTKDQSQLGWEEEFNIRFARIVDVTGFNDEYTREGYKLSKRDYEIKSFIRSVETKTIEKAIAVVEDYACRLFNCPDPEELSKYRPQGRDFQRSHYNLLGAIQALKKLLPNPNTP